jgi:hypothetical protein
MSDESLTPEDRRLIDAIAEHTQPRPMTPARLAAFNRALERPAAWHVGLFRPLAYAGAAVATAALALWIGGPVRAPSVQTPVDADAGAALQALVDSDDADADAVLPDDYLMLASVLDVPVGDL